MRAWPCVLWLAVAGCAFEPLFDEIYPRCDAGTCPAGCICLLDQICVSEDESVPPGECLQPGSCEDGCPWGCVCVDEICRLPGFPGSGYCRESDPVCPFEIDPDLVVTTAEDEQDGGPDNTDIDAALPGGLSLREALVLATHTEGPHHISFGLQAEAQIWVQPEFGELPPVPSLAWLDGGESGQELRGGLGISGDGLRLQGGGVVVSGLEVSDFPGAGIRVERGSKDVHLFRMASRGNGAGLEASGCENLVVGRGRELDPPPWYPYPETDEYRAWGMNWFDSNEGDGMHLARILGLSIYGTWVGFGDERYGAPCRANGGDGIVLEDVWDAVVGVQRVSDVEADAFQGYLESDAPDYVLGPEHPFPAFVAVGCNAGCGVRVIRGGDIHMPGLLIGDTPLMMPYGQNAGTGLSIEANEGQVTFGPKPWAVERETLWFGMIYVVDALALEIRDAAAEVILTGTHFVNIENRDLEHYNEDVPDLGMLVSRNTAPVSLRHLSWTGGTRQTVLRLEDLQAPVEVVNCLFWQFWPRDRPLLQLAGLGSEQLDFYNNYSYGYYYLMEGVTELEAHFKGIEGDSPFRCGNSTIRPADISCPQIDLGYDYGQDQTALEGHYTGCGPDIGAFECVTPACQEQIECPP
ncbi:MAG: hypothetical protein JXR96_08275 [Deltaproteobacteria bacterium]|nr:hypothetical protein [Deltaproteobacteria bacterium]